MVREDVAPTTGGLTARTVYPVRLDGRTVLRSRPMKGGVVT
jgi:hypothetical protein